MKSSPLPKTPRRAAPPPAAVHAPASVARKVFGALALAFGGGLALLTLIAAVEGQAAIGFYDVTIGAMILVFSFQAARFGYGLLRGR